MGALMNEVRKLEHYYHYEYIIGAKTERGRNERMEDHLHREKARFKTYFHSAGVFCSSIHITSSDIVSLVGQCNQRAASSCIYREIKRNVSLYNTSTLIQYVPHSPAYGLYILFAFNFVCMYKETRQIADLFKAT